MGGLNDLLTGFFDVINNFVLSFGIKDIGLAYVLDIAIYTLILKTIVLPLYIYQQKSTIGMSSLQPKMKEIQEKYKNDPKRMQEEQVKLYTEMGVNPLKGCLPLFVQMPIFAAMFYVIYHFKGFEGVPFLWLKDLAAKDPYYILPTITAITQFISVKIMSRHLDADQRKMQDKMGIIMSGVFFFICMNYKAALAIYFISSSIISAVQGVIVNGILRKKQAEKDAIKAAQEKERAEREAREKAERREQQKRKKKKVSDSKDGEVKTSKNKTSTGDKPKKKKRTSQDAENLKPESNKDDKVVE